MREKTLENPQSYAVDQGHFHYNFILCNLQTLFKIPQLLLKILMDSLFWKMSFSHFSQKESSTYKVIKIHSEIVDLHQLFPYSIFVKMNCWFLKRLLERYHIQVTKKIQYFLYRAESLKDLNKIYQIKTIASRYETKHQQRC